jgi:glycerate-2-kinase
MLFKNQNKIIDNGKTLEIKNSRADILDILSSALEAVNPYKAVKSKFYGNDIIFKSKKFNISEFENVFLIGFGKASVSMAQAVCDSTGIKKGVVITNETNKKVNSKNVLTYVGDHPITSKRSIDGTKKILDLIKEIGEDDLLIVLISGGGSALLSKPRISLKDMQKTTDLLLKSGANINEINTIRKHLSFVKGGQLVGFVKGKIISFIISDIINDPIEFIASGPTYPDSTTFLDAKKIFEKYKLWRKIPQSAKIVIVKGMEKKIAETLKKDASNFDRLYNFIIANNEIACKAAENKANELNYNVMILTTSLEGEAKEVGKYLAEKSVNYSTDNKKLLFICGGETTVTVKGNGKGGRNQEMVLGGVFTLSDKDVIFASFATDGIDGNCDAAGAIADGYTLNKAKRKNLDFKTFINQNNSYNFFKKIDDLLITGPTGTNVMDIQILLKFNDKNNIK